MRRELFSGLVLTAMMFAACSDDLDNSQRYNDGLLHLKLTFNDPKGQWAEGSAPQTRALPAIPMTADGMEGLTLYLHCEEQDYIEEPAPSGENETETRGQRLTGEAFDDASLTCFGLYGEVGSEKVLGELGTTYNKILKSGFTYHDDTKWYESNSDVELAFTGDGYWPEDQNGTFYAWAPFHYNNDGVDDANEAKNISVAMSGGVPTLTYTMQNAEADNKDILAAQTTLSRAKKNSDGIELQFRHVLSALKFKGTVLKGIQATVGGSVEYTLQVNKIRVIGIYNTGTCTIGETTWTQGATTDYCETAGIDNTTVNINTDEHCFLVLPQTAPTGAKLKLDCTVLNSSDAVVKEHLYIQAPLEDLTWLPGHSYTYTINDTELTHKIKILSASTPPTTLTSLTYPVDGDIRTFKVQSYLTNGDESDGFPAPWHPQYYDTSTSTWKDGLPLGYVLLKENGDPILGDELLNIPGSVEATTYQLEVLERFENSEVITTLLSNMPNGYGTTAAPVDLSLYNTRGTATGQAWPGGRSTANCYIINGYGHFKFPLVYGNAIKNGATNAWAYREMDENEIFVNYLDNHIEVPYIIDDVKNDAGTAVSGINDVVPIIVWQDEKNLVLPNSLKLSEDGGLGFMEFTISEQYLKSGNIILGIRETSGSQRILWSWHIWVSARHFDETVNVSATKTEYGTKSLDFAQWNLGWRVPESMHYSDKNTQIRMKQNGSPTGSGESGTTTVKQTEGDVTISGSNLYYQHGRKDPMPAAYQEKRGSTTTNVDMTVEIHKLGYGTGWTQEGSVWNITKTGDVPMGTAIQNPDFLFAAEAGDWMHPRGHETTKAGRWDPEKAGNYGTSRANMLKSESAFAHIKTVYDPCPFGFTVPPCFAYELLSDWTEATNYNETPFVLKARVYYHGTSGGEKLNKLYFYFTGWRTWNHGGIENLGTNGYHWTAGVNDRNGCMLHINGNAFNDFNYYFCRNHTEPIRPVRDNEDERISKLPFTIQGGSVNPESSLVRRK